MFTFYWYSMTNKYIVPFRVGITVHIIKQLIRRIIFFWSNFVLKTNIYKSIIYGYNLNVEKLIFSEMFNLCFFPGHLFLSVYLPGFVIKVNKRSESSLIASILYYYSIASTVRMYDWHNNPLCLNLICGAGGIMRRPYIPSPQATKLSI